MVVNNSHLLNLKFLYAIGLVSLENKLNYSGCLQANAGSHHWVVTINTFSPSSLFYSLI